MEDNQTVQNESNVRDRSQMAWVAVIILILLLLGLLLASIFDLWPFNDSSESDDNDTTNEQSVDGDSDNNSDDGSTQTTTGGTNNTTGSTDTTTGGTDTTTTGSNGGSSIFDVSVTVQNGETKEEVNAKADGISPVCIDVETSTDPDTEVCTYTQGTKVVTVTYTGGEVVEVNRAGF